MTGGYGYAGEFITDTERYYRIIGFGLFNILTAMCAAEKSWGVAKAFQPEIIVRLAAQAALCLCPHSNRNCPQERDAGAVFEAQAGGL